MPWYCIFVKYWTVSSGWREGHWHIFTFWLPSICEISHFSFVFMFLCFFVSLFLYILVSLYLGILVSYLSFLVSVFDFCGGPHQSLLVSFQIEMNSYSLKRQSSLVLNISTFLRRGRGNIMFSKIWGGGRGTKIIPNFKEILSPLALVVRPLNRISSSECP